MTILAQLRTAFLFLSLTYALTAASQCKIENNVFESGEHLTYDLYFKYGLVNMKAGWSTMSVKDTRFNNIDAYKMTLLAHSTGMANKIFTVADTISSYMTKDLVPLAFTKNALEGDDHTIEKAIYTYTPQGVSINTSRIKNGKQRFNETLFSESCIYDMMSIVYYARTLDYSSMKKGEYEKVVFLSGKRKVNMEIEHQGTEVISANDGKKYNCIKLVLMINDKAFENKEEAMKVYITNDQNRMPVRIDSKLKIGATQVVLKKYKGNKFPVKTN